MLKQRVITALVLTAILFGALFGLTAYYFAWVIALVILIGAWEWASLAGFHKGWQRLAYTLVIALVLAAIAGAIGLCQATEQGLNLAIIKPLLVISCAWWALALLLVQGYPSSAILWGHSLTRLLMGVLVLVPTGVALVFVRYQVQGVGLIVLLLGVVATADIGGYFAGRRFGKHKLAPAVSPGKTLEGFAGGLLSNLCLAALVAYLTATNAWLVLAIVVPTSLFSVLGDLLESMLKRHANVKDSGSLLPGHGGLLDRVDSITAAAPVFALALLASGWSLA
jgi:phosphatidate cytidylyltransferase